MPNEGGMGSNTMFEPGPMLQARPDARRRSHIQATGKIRLLRGFSATQGLGRGRGRRTIVKRRVPPSVRPAR
jgi:hypothetical protein